MGKHADGTVTAGAQGAPPDFPVSHRFAVPRTYTGFVARQVSGCAEIRHGVLDSPQRSAILYGYTFDIASSQWAVMKEDSARYFIRRFYTVPLRIDQPQIGFIMSRCDSQLKILRGGSIFRRIRSFDLPIEGQIFFQIPRY